VKCFSNCVLNPNNDGPNQLAMGPWCTQSRRSSVSHFAYPQDQLVPSAHAWTHDILRIMSRTGKLVQSLEPIVASNGEICAPQNALLTMNIPLGEPVDIQDSKPLPKKGWHKEVASTISLE
jgi:hypothetical protein